MPGRKKVTQDKLDNQHFIAPAATFAEKATKRAFKFDRRETTDAKNS